MVADATSSRSLVSVTGAFNVVDGVSAIIIALIIAPIVIIVVATFVTVIVALLPALVIVTTASGASASTTARNSYVDFRPTFLGTVWVHHVVPLALIPLAYSTA